MLLTIRRLRHLPPGGCLCGSFIAYSGANDCLRSALLAQCGSGLGSRCQNVNFRWEPVGCDVQCTWVHHWWLLAFCALFCLLIKCHSRALSWKMGGSFELVLKQSWERSVSDFIFAALVQERRWPIALHAVLSSHQQCRRIPGFQRCKD